MPHRPGKLLLPASGRYRRQRRLDGGGPCPERPRAYLQMNPQDTSTILARLADTLESRLPANGGDPSASYTAKLLARGPDAFLKKIGEEATELRSERRPVGKAGWK